MDEARKEVLNAYADLRRIEEDLADAKEIAEGMGYGTEGARDLADRGLDIPRIARDIKPLLEDVRDVADAVEETLTQDEARWVWKNRSV